MPRLNKFRVRIETGDKGVEEPIRFNFNSHLLPLEDVSGGTQAGEVFEGGYEVRSVAHSMALVGPDKGEWSIKKIDKSVKLKNYREVLTLASIVEKETSLKKEKPIIAQVFLNRLNLNMKLQSDPTVIFAIRKELGELDREFIIEDLSFESEYNTYLHRGLPIGPIAK